MANDLPERLRFGPYEVDLYTHELWKHGTRIKLVGQPFEILTVMLARPGELITRDNLRTRLWPEDTFVDFNHGLNAAVNKLRDALSDSADEPRYIETLPRRGYRFIAKVETVPRPDHRSVPVASAPAVTPPAAAETQKPLVTESVAEKSATVPASEATSQPEKKPRSRFSKAILIFAIALVALGLLFAGVHAAIKIGMWVWGHREPGTNSTAVAAGGLIPLTNLPDPTSEPAFSPDGNHVAFRRVGYGASTAGIFVKAIGSSELLQLSNGLTDCCPTWSPDGRTVAFSRFTDKQHQIVSVPADGGNLNLLNSAALGFRQGDLSWSPNGEDIAFSGLTSRGTSAIYLFSFKYQKPRRITDPPLLNHDRAPAFSPDGERIAFIRTRETGLPENVMVMPAEGGESIVVLSFGNGIVGPLAWTADGASILFAAGTPELHRVSIANGQEEPISEATSPATHPSVARRGYRLAFDKPSAAVSVQELPLSPSPAQPHNLLVTDTGKNEAAQISPDGKKIAFMSSRSGSMEIWMSDRDGSNATQMSAVGGAGTPRWSPDSQFIAFDRQNGDNPGIFVVNVDGGLPRHIIAETTSQNLVPNWSRDGKWVYFASTRTGAWQVWKVSPQGGQPVQVTAHGGFAAWESRSGKILYSKHNQPNPEIWEVPEGGGEEFQVSHLIRPETWASWQPTENGILFLELDVTGDPTVMFFNFSTQKVQRLNVLDKLPFWLSVTPDGKSVLYEHLDQENSHVMLLENFR